MTWVTWPTDSQCAFDFALDAVDIKCCSRRRSIYYLALATFTDAPTAHDRNVANHELAAEDARTCLHMRVVTQREVRDVCYFTKLRGPFACWNTLRDGLDALKSILKL